MPATAILTPNRQLQIQCDYPETTLAEMAAAVSRGKWQIRAASGSSNVWQLSSGGWALKPLQNNLANVLQVTDPTGSQMQAADFDLAPGVVSVPTIKKDSDLPGATTGGVANLVVSGGNAFERNVGQSQDYTTANLAAYQATLPAPTLASANYPQQRHARGKAAHLPNTGYFFRLLDYAHRFAATDNLFTFMYGGGNMNPGGGEHALTLRGDGLANLYIRQPTLAWANVDQWLAVDQSQLHGGNIGVMVVPHSGPGAQYVTFGTSLTNAQTRALRAMGGLTNAVVPGFHHTEAISGLKAVSPKAQWPAINNMAGATGSGYPQIELPQNSRARWQVFRLTYQTGTLQDAPFPVPLYATTRSPLRMRWNAWMPVGTSVSAVLYDSSTGTPLTSTQVYYDGLGRPIGADFTPVAGASAYYAVFTLTTDTTATQTPVLWQYSVTKDGVYAATRAPQWTMAVTQWDITGAGKDPETEAAGAGVEDLLHTYNRLYRRGDIPARIVNLDTSGAGHDVILFNGYINKADAVQTGSTNQDGSSHIMQDPDWRSSGLSFTPYYKRLRKTLTTMRVFLLGDTDPRLPAQPDASQWPYKVTDMVRNALGWCGFPPSQIDVPDAPIRFWPVPGDQEDSLVIDPGVEVGRLIMGWLADYLGWYLTWDPNAGTAPGMWRVRKPSVPAANGLYTNVWQFVDRQQGRAVDTIDMVPGAYGAGTSPIMNYQDWTIAPEANLIHVVGVSMNGRDGDATTIQQWARNAASTDYYATNGGAAYLTADWTNPDYLGTTQLEILQDPGLNSRAAVDWMTRRLFDRTAHALQMCLIETPLWFLTDTADTVTVATYDSRGFNTFASAPAYRTLGDGTVQQRPWRYYDPVQVTRYGVTTQYLVTSVHPGAEYDGRQTAMVEMVAATPLTANA